jgi:hypothetical protein
LLFRLIVIISQEILLSIRLRLPPTVSFASASSSATAAGSTCHLQRQASASGQAYTLAAKRENTVNSMVKGELLRWKK